MDHRFIHNLSKPRSVQKTRIAKKDLANIPLAHRSFANIAYLAPMTEPVEPSDPPRLASRPLLLAAAPGLNLTSPSTAVTR